MFPIALDLHGGLCRQVRCISPSDQDEKKKFRRVSTFAYPPNDSVRSLVALPNQIIRADFRLQRLQTFLLFNLLHVAVKESGSSPGDNGLGPDPQPLRCFGFPQALSILSLPGGIVPFKRLQSLRVSNVCWQHIFDFSVMIGHAKGWPTPLCILDLLHPFQVKYQPRPRLGSSPKFFYTTA
jgi:hypothetical protein